jgi:hypothetical protein
MLNMHTCVGVAVHHVVHAADHDVGPHAHQPHSRGLQLDDVLLDLAIPVIAKESPALNMKAVRVKRM